MKARFALAIMAVAVASSFNGPWAHAQGAASASGPGTAKAAPTEEMTSGEVRKVDKGNGKVTIRHGEIRHLNMPPMTMVFTAKDKSLVADVKPGEKIRFKAVTENGQYLVTDIQPER